MYNPIIILQYLTFEIYSISWHHCFQFPHFPTKHMQCITCTCILPLRQTLKPRKSHYRVDQIFLPTCLRIFVPKNILQLPRFHSVHMLMWARYSVLLLGSVLLVNKILWWLCSIIFVILLHYCWMAACVLHFLSSLKWILQSVKYKCLVNNPKHCSICIDVAL